MQLLISKFPLGETRLTDPKNNLQVPTKYKKSPICKIRLTKIKCEMVLIPTLHQY